MTALVTGANGFMGSAVVRALVADGQQVRAFVRPSADLRNLDGLDIEVVPGDFLDPDSIVAAMKGCRTLYHVGALVRFWLPPRQLGEFDRVNVHGTKNVLAAALRQGLEKVVYTSTIATIGSHGKDDPVTEEHIFNLWEMGMQYERSKYSAELEAWRFGARGLPLVMVLPCGPIGARDYRPNPLGKLLLDFYHRKVPGYMEGGGNFIDVDDVATGHLLAAKRGKVGERYLLGNQNLSIVDFFRIVEEVSTVAAPRRKIPYAGALALARLLQFVSDRITRRHPLLTPNLTKTARVYYYADTTKARTELGFEPRYTVRDAVVKAFRWFTANGYIPEGKPRRRALVENLERYITSHPHCAVGS